MIKIVTDEEVHEMDIELIELFAVYLFDKDVVGMTDLIYVVEDRMALVEKMTTLKLKNKTTFTYAKVIYV